MRRLVAILALVVAVPAIALLGVNASGDDGGYEVRAIFDNVSSIVPGEDVRVAGAKVGSIKSMSVTADNKAAMVMKIKTPGFAPFHTNARCRLRPQSLIGERFVDCQPGTASSPVLPLIDDGEGRGQHLLPVSHTGTAVDLDLVNDTLRLPYRQRLSILLDEFGTGLAGKGPELNRVIHRANPALAQTDRVLAILARQNHVLANLARDSDTALGPITAQRRRVVGFINKANATGQATAERRQAIEESFRRLPRFLAELRPTMADLGNTANQSIPVLANIRRSAPDFSRFIQGLGPFSTAARPAFRALGKTSVRGRTALLRSRPLLADLRRLGRGARPASVKLDQITASLDRTGGLERIVGFLFNTANATNGFDQLGHYLRTSLIINFCSTYTSNFVDGCKSTYTNVNSAAAAAGKSGRAAAAPTGKSAGSVRAPSALEQLLAPLDKRAQRGVQRVRDQSRQTPADVQVQDQPVLDYLFGADR
jgi:ABC-type transporter Mla subunit MlaD